MTRGSVPVWRSIQVQFALAYIAIVAAVLVLLNTYPLMISRDLVITSKETSLQNQASLIASALAISETLTEEGVGQAMTELSADSFQRVLITDSNGLILFDTKSSNNSKGQYALLWDITTALRNRGSNVFRSQYQDGVFESWAVTPVVYRNMVIGSIYLYEVDTEQGLLLKGIQDNLRNLSVVICLVALVASVLVSGALTRRIADLLSAIRTVRQGNYDHRVHIHGKDELSHLAQEFNQLTDRLQVTDEVRRRFVSDASHELKTPLASIRLLTDSILQNNDMDPELVQDFVGDIGEEAERLTRISEKLLSLTRMDSSVTSVRESVDFATVVERVIHMLQPLVQQKGLTLQSQLQSQCHVLSTPDDLYQIAFNLIENAIKYNRLEGSVLVNLWSVQDLVYLKIEDTGVGIPADELDKVFDRFYRVDKARSRAAGGTGLGLSIVKDTVQLHQGQVSVHLREEEGSCFEVVFPRHYGGTI